MHNELQKRITEVLEELYSLDTKFKVHEPKLRELVEALLLSKPDTHFDEHFARTLRASLIPKTKKSSILSPYRPHLISKLAYGVSGGLVTLMVIIPLAFVLTKKATVFAPGQVKNETVGIALTPQISSKGNNAFGSLALASSTGSSPARAAKVQDSTSTLAVNPQMTTMMAVTDLSTTSEEQASTSLQAKVPSKKYIYEGATFALSDAQGNVLKRTTGVDSRKQLTSLIGSARFNLPNISTFSNLNLRTIDLSEDKKEGYSIHIDADQGSVTFTQNSPTWVQSTTTATSTALDAQALVAIASAFVKDHGIDTSIYATPFVGHGSTTVVYPLLLNGKEVYGQDGYQYGMQITVDTQAKKVARVDNLTSQIYESSQYVLETDPEQILVIVNSLYGGEGQGSTSQKISLGTPKQVFMRSITSTTATSSELYIPALLFPIKDSQEVILIPLVKDFLVKGKDTAFIPRL